MLLDSISFGINEGDKIGLIAKNGTGKTTLLRIIAGKEEADSGTIVFRNDLRIAILEQNPEFADDSVTAADAAPELGNEASEAHSRYIRLLSGLGVNDTSVPLAKLSGGQRKRIAMARAIATEPQLLILDEPTNHLDINAIEWLEAYLAKARMTLLMVTHDRYFLDRVCSKIIEIDRTQIYTYDGNYDYFLRRRAERISAMSAELDRVNNLLRKEQDWMSRQPQARAGKAKYRIEQFYDLKERSRVNLTERNVDLGNASKVYIGSKIFEARHISKSFGDRVIVRDFSYDFARGEKVGIIGANGIGKSTFVKMLLGLVRKTAANGTSARRCVSVTTARTDLLRRRASASSTSSPTSPTTSNTKAHGSTPRNCSSAFSLTSPPSKSTPKPLAAASCAVCTLPPC